MNTPRVQGQHGFRPTSESSNGLQELIRALAYEKWLAKGRPTGSEKQDWLEAEAECRCGPGSPDSLPEPLLAGGPPLLQALMENSPAAVYVKDLDGRYLLLNGRCERLLRLPRQHILGKTDAQLFPPDIAQRLHGDELQVIRTRAAVEREEQVLLEDGLHTTLSIKFPLLSASGDLFAIGGICTDITERKRFESELLEKREEYRSIFERARRRLVAEHAVTHALAESDTLEQAGPRILQAICQSLDWDVGVIWLVDCDVNRLRCVVVWHGANVRVPEFAAACRSREFDPGIGLPGRVWSSGKPAWIADVTQDTNFPRAPIAVREGLHGAFGFPIRLGEEALGIIEFFSREIRQPDQELLETFASLGSQLGQFIEHKRAEKELHERALELRLAHQIQQGLLPKASPRIPGFQIGFVSEPAQETGGDYLDFFDMPHGALGIVIGDASGHGVAAALLMAETRAYMRGLAPTRNEVGKILTLANCRLAEDIEKDHFVTLCLARLVPESRTLVYASAGHWPAYVLDAQGQTKDVLDSTGIPLGIDATATYPTGTSLVLAPGDMVLLLTDGIFESCSADGVMFGMERTLDVIRQHHHEPPETILVALLEKVDQFSNGVQLDDRTAILLRVEHRA